MGDDFGWVRDGIKDGFLDDGDDRENDVEWVAAEQSRQRTPDDDRCGWWVDKKPQLTTQEDPHEYHAETQCESDYG